MGRRARPQTKPQTQPAAPEYPPGAPAFDEMQKAKQYAERLQRGEIIPNNELITQVAPLKKKYPQLFGIQGR